MKPRTASRAGSCWRCILPALCFLVAMLATGPVAAEAPSIERRAIEISQAALGNTLGPLEFIDAAGERRNLEEFRGRPLVLSIIYTACVHSCQVSTRYLDRLVKIARDALGEDSFTVLTIGFDRPVDTPEQMAAYARRYGIRDPHWHFLSIPDDATRNALLERTGFVFEHSPRGFDHTVQLTVLDRDGRVWRQVYGEVFPTPQFVEPLKSLVFDRPLDEAGLLGRVGDRVRLFCTVYDAQGDRYIFDYSLFAGIFIGTLVLGSAILWLLTELRRAQRSRTA